MNKRIKGIAHKLQEWVASEESKPGFNPFENDMYYVLCKLEKAYKTLELMNEARKVNNGLWTAIEEIRAE